MNDALIFSGFFLTLVLATQIGRRRHYAALAVMPFVSCVAIGTLVIGTGSHTYTVEDVVAGSVGAVAGIAIGIALKATMLVYRSPTNAKLYTRAGVTYLAIWLAVLLARIAFVWLMQNSPSFASQVGEFLATNDLNGDGIALFFLLMALSMVLTREVGVLIRAARIEHAGPSSAVAREPGDARMRA